MIELEKNVYITELFSIYGELLSLTQQKMLKYYYEMDLSLSEIAQQENISRNAVHDALKNGVDNLMFFEDKLHLLQKKIQIDEKLSSLNKEDYLKFKKIFMEEE